MALKEELEAAGNALFRVRSYAPLPVLLFVAIVIWRTAASTGVEPARGWQLVCLAIALIGLAIRAYTAGHVPAGTSGRSTRSLRAEQLNTSGMYSVVRHPLYLGNYFMWLGPALLPRSVAVAALVTLIFWLYHERIMFAEEAFLRREYGSMFDDWASRTPAFIPALGQWRPPALGFSLRTALKREYTGLLGVLVVFTLLDAIADAVANGSVRADRFWLVLLAGCFVIYVVLLTLARRTRVLAVEGR